MALPYGVICKCYHTEFNEWDGEPFVAEYNDTLESVDVNGVFLVGGFSYETDEIKPYLRSMSSMTEEEFEEYGNITEHISIGSLDFNIANPNAFDWLNAHHFDYRGLIEKGLAIEVTKENNPYKD